MSNQKWEVGPVKLVNGCDAVIHRFCEKRQRYLGVWEDIYGGSHAAEWHTGGSHNIAGTGDHRLDLAPPPKKTLRVRLWLNVYDGGISYPYGTRTIADMEASSSRFACIEIDREVEEGEGL